MYPRPNPSPTQTNVQKPAMCGIIRDGYTEPGFIREVPGLHPELRFSYRPALGIETEEWLRSFQFQPLTKHMDATAQFMADHLQSWSLTEADGQAADIEPDRIKIIRYALFVRLQYIIYGREASDLDPLWSKEKQRDESVANYAASVQRKAPGIVREEEAVKN